MLHELNVGIYKNLKNKTKKQPMSSRHVAIPSIFSKKQESWTNNIKGMF